MASFQTILRQLRQRENLTQGELAQKLQMSVSSISMYEKGNRKPSLEVLESFADFFNVDMDYLLGKSSRSTYYLDPEMAKLAQILKEKPQYAALCQQILQLSPDALARVAAFIQAQLAAK